MSGQGIRLLGESLIDSNASWFRVVRAFRGFICFFQVEVGDFAVAIASAANTIRKVPKIKTGKGKSTNGSALGFEATLWHFIHHLAPATLSTGVAHKMKAHGNLWLLA